MELTITAGTAGKADLEREQWQRDVTAVLPGLRRYAHTLVGSRASGGMEAEDLVQECLARAWRYRASYVEAEAGERGFLAWLKRASLRIWLDRREQAGRRPRLERISDDDGNRELAAEPLVADWEVREDLEITLACLDDVERDVLLRFHRENESVSEISTACELPEGTVKSHLHRARKKLIARKKCMKRTASQESDSCERENEVTQDD